MAQQSADAVIIGVGGAGGILAAELAKAGLRVVGLERGPRLETKDFEPHDELRFFQRMDLRPDPKRQPVTYRPNENTRATRIGVINNGNQAGGGTVHYGTMSWRFQDQIFRERSHNLERYGPDAIPEGSGLMDWPLTYADLEPFYDQAEYELGIGGKAGNIQGRIQEGGNVFESPRQREYPLPPVVPDNSCTIFDEAASSLGYHPFPTPKAIATQPYHGRPGCTYCGFCQAFGCHVGAKSSILVTKLPEADATGNFDLRTGSMVYRINSDNSGRVTGVSYYGPGGQDATIEADLVILSPAVYDCTRLLLLSATDRFPDGLANSSGLVGKYFFAHGGARVMVGFDDKYIHVNMGPNNGKHTIDDYEADNFDHSGLGFIQGGAISVGTIALDGGPIGVVQGMNPPPGMPRWGAPFRDFFSKYYARHLSISNFTELLPWADQYIDLDPNVRDEFGLPAPRITHDWRKPSEIAKVNYLFDREEEIARAMGGSIVWRAGFPGPGPGAHHAGGTRMSANPREGVVNRYSQSWDHPNLFILGTATYPTLSGHNPTLTLQALAYYAADAIVKRYIRNPGPLV